MNPIGNVKKGQPGYEPPPSRTSNPGRGSSKTKSIPTIEKKKNVVNTRNELIV
jgi:hypothetical protein